MELIDFRSMQRLQSLRSWKHNSKKKMLMLKMEAKSLCWNVQR